MKYTKCIQYFYDNFYDVKQTSDCFWLLPEILAGSRDLQMVICHSMNVGSVVGILRSGWGRGIRTIPAVIKFVWIFAITGNCDDKILLSLQLVSFYWYPHAHESPRETFKHFIVLSMPRHSLYLQTEGSSVVCRHNDHWCYDPFHNT